MCLARQSSSDGSGIWEIRQSESSEIGGRLLERWAGQPCPCGTLVDRGAAVKVRV
jgi:hypothetical protein